MAVVRRGNRWYYRFILDGKKHQRSTGLEATGENRTSAEAIEGKLTLGLVEGSHGIIRLRARSFTDAAEEFLKQCERDHRDHPNTWKRLRTSFTSISHFFTGCLTWPRCRRNFHPPKKGES